MGMRESKTTPAMPAGSMYASVVMLKETPMAETDVSGSGNSPAMMTTTWKSNSALRPPCGGRVTK